MQNTLNSVKQYKLFNNDLNSLDYHRNIKEQNHISLRKKSLDSLISNKRRRSQTKDFKLNLLISNNDNIDPKLIEKYIALRKERYDINNLGKYIDSLGEIYNDLKTQSKDFNFDFNFNNSEELISVLVPIRKLLSDKNSLNYEIISHPNFQTIFQILHNDNLTSFIIAYETTWILSNTLYFYNNSLIPNCENYNIYEIILKCGNRFSRNQEILEKIVWAIGNLACENINTRESIYKYGIFQFLIDISLLFQLESSSELLYTCYWAISNCFQNNKGDKGSKLQLRVPNSNLLMIKLIQNASSLYFENGENVINIWKIINCLMYNEENRNEILQELKGNEIILTGFLDIFKYNYLHLYYENICIIGNLVYYDDEIALKFIELGLFSIIRNIIKDDNHTETLKTECCWIINNLITSCKSNTIILEEFIKVISEEDFVSILINKTLSSTGSDLNEYICT